MNEVMDLRPLEWRTRPHSEDDMDGRRHTNDYEENAEVNIKEMFE